MLYTKKCPAHAPERFDDFFSSLLGHPAELLQSALKLPGDQGVSLRAPVGIGEWIHQRPISQRVLEHSSWVYARCDEPSTEFEKLRGELGPDLPVPDGVVLRIGDEVAEHPYL